MYTLVPHPAHPNEPRPVRLRAVGTRQDLVEAIERQAREDSNGEWVSMVVEPDATVHDAPALHLFLHEHDVAVFTRVGTDRTGASVYRLPGWRWVRAGEDPEARAGEEVAAPPAHA